MNIQKRLSGSQVEDSKRTLDLIKSSDAFFENHDFLIWIIENSIDKRTAGLWIDGYETNGSYTST